MNEISLLYSREKKCGSLGERTLYHLSLDRAFASFCQDPGKLAAFLRILGEPALNRSDIAFRREILEEFQKKPALLSDLRACLDDLSGLRQDFERQKRERRHSLRDQNTGTASENARLLLQVSAETLRRTLVTVGELDKLLIRNAVTSEGLRRFRDRVGSLTQHPEFAELLEFCIPFTYLSVTAPLNLSLKIGADGRYTQCSLINPSEVHYTDPERKVRKPLFKRDRQEVYPCAILMPKTGSVYTQMQSQPYHELSAAFEDIAGQIFRMILSVDGELDFYEVALSYVRTLTGWGIPLCSPDLQEEGGEEVRDFYDLLLLSDERRRNQVFPNSFELAPDRIGTVLMGKNGSGKTVFLRSFGSLWILAQAGLPIPAKSARLTLKTGVFTQFSEGEKEFVPGNDAGRFEQEVREMAGIVDQVDSRSLLLLNETFQTTAYEEGAAGLVPILRYLGGKGVRFLLVTHLRQIEDCLSPDEVQLLTTAEGFRVLPRK
ncbi:MAG: hypothetical protein ACI3YK_02905 [Eubacteriales bacterium]